MAEPRHRPGGGRALGALVCAALLVALVALGLAGLVGWGTPVPQPVIPQHVIPPPAIPPPPVAPAPRQRPVSPPRVRSTLRHLWKRLARELLLPAAFFLPRERRRRLERRLRGREELRKLRLADRVVVSYGNSGRTWLRVLLSRFLQLRLGLDRAALIGFENLHQRDPRAPRILFTHDNYLRDHTGEPDGKRDYRGKKVVLLVRHPADVAVSQYFQWRHRMRPRKKALNRYPAHGAELDVFGFLMDADAGLLKIIGFLNGWTRELPRLGDDALVVRYEDLHADAAGGLGRVLRFMGWEPTEAELADCVAFAGAENMRRLEAEGAFRSGKLRPRDAAAGPDGRKVRRAEVGGWRDHLDETQAAAVERLIEDKLLPGLGYLAREGGPAAAGRVPSASAA
jgi:hypothetical protein